MRMFVKYRWYDNGTTWTAQKLEMLRDNFTFEELRAVVRRNAPQPGLQDASVRIETDGPRRPCTVFRGLVSLED